MKKIFVVTGESELYPSCPQMSSKSFNRLQSRCQSALSSLEMSRTYIPVETNNYCDHDVAEP